MPLSLGLGQTNINCESEKISAKFISLLFYYYFITGPPNGPVLFCTLSSVVVCNARGRSAGRRLAGRVTVPVVDTARKAGQYGYVPVGRHLVLCLSCPENCIAHGRVKLSLSTK